MDALRIGDTFPNLRVETTAGPLELRTRWRERPLVVMFMRHFGCTFCREQLIRMGRAHDDLRDAGAEILAIFQYTAEATEDFCASRGVPFACVGDPLREGYARVSLGRGDRRALLGWGVARRYVGAVRAGGTVGAGPSGGDMAQLPGTFVMDRDGRLTLAHYAVNSADTPDVATVLAAVRAASPAEDDVAATSQGVSTSAGQGRRRK